MLGQMFMCEGKPGKVVELIASGRQVEGKFDGMIRDALTADFRKLDTPVGIGGVILQEKGKCKFHVLPETASEPLDTPDKVKNWLKFFEMDPPIISMGTALSHDPKNWKIRLEHFHCFNQDRTKAGHCHYDTHGPEASYRAYLVPGHRLLRVDPPQ
ncbi:unnamed protein product [Calicophoron daubneyi]